MFPIRILLASYQPILRSGLRLLLEREPDFKIVAEAANGREALVLSEYAQPDITLLDVNLPVVNGIEVAREILMRTESPRSIFVSNHIDRAYVHEAFRAGARGYVQADNAAADLPRAIRLVVASDRLFLSPTISAQLLEQHVNRGNISDYDRDLWCLIAAGHDEDDIATALSADVDKIRADARSLRSLFCWNALPEALTRAVESQLRA